MQMTSFLHPSIGSMMALTKPYLQRLDLQESILESLDKLELLKLLHERHLERVPFENTAQHGVVGGPAVLDLQVTANKVLHHGRGGFCLELNTLFGAWLEELGYSVTLVPALVSNEGVFREMPTHVVLMVSLPASDPNHTNNNNQLYFCDVGFGEPACHPLLYEMDLEQPTPEGMISCLRQTGDDDIVLHWKKGDAWLPRLKWSYSQSLLGENGPTLTDLEPALKAVQSEVSPFSQKLIVCRLTRDQKTTIAGNKIKITRNRFSSEESVDYESISSNEEAREKLKELFGYPLEASDGLDLSRSLQAEAGLWTQM
jgi:arylamine N-acetyltransferase